LKIWNWWKWRK